MSPTRLGAVGRSGTRSGPRVPGVRSSGRPTSPGRPGRRDHPENSACPAISRSARRQQTLARAGSGATRRGAGRAGRGEPAPVAGAAGGAAWPPPVHRRRATRPPISRGRHPGRPPQVPARAHAKSASASPTVTGAPPARPGSRTASVAPWWRRATRAASASDRRSAPPDERGQLGALALVPALTRDRGAAGRSARLHRGPHEVVEPCPAVRDRVERLLGEAGGRRR